MILSIIIPSFNEEKTLAHLIHQLESIPWGKQISSEIIIINDGSIDNTAAITSELSKEYSNISLIFNEKNLGKSQSVRKGILESKGDLVIIQDADFEYNPQEIPLLIEHLLKYNLDVIYGNRFGKNNSKGYLANYLGNKLLTYVSNLFIYSRLKTWIPDMEVCYKLIKGNIARDIAKTIASKSTFGIEPEITAKLSKYKQQRKHLKFGALPISYYPRTMAEGKKMKAVSDGLKALKEIVLFNL